jgi:hypothetical protein
MTGPVMLAGEQRSSGSDVPPFERIGYRAAQGVALEGSPPVDIGVRVMIAREQI